MKNLQNTLEQKLPRECFFSLQYQDFSFEIDGVTIECDELYLKIYGFSKLSLDIPKSFEGLTFVEEILNQLEEKFAAQLPLPYEDPCYIPNLRVLMILSYCLVQAEHRLTEEACANMLVETLATEQSEEVESGFL